MQVGATAYRTQFCVFQKAAEGSKITHTDLNQAEDIPPLGSAPLPDPQSQNQISGVKDRKNHESIDSD